MKKRMAAMALALGMLLWANGGLARDSDFVWTVIDAKTSDRVHLREGPSAKSRSLGLYFTGTSVLRDPNPDQEWVWVNVGMEAGYIKSEYLYPGNDWSRVIPQQPYGMVNNPKAESLVNMRTYPNTQAAVVTRFRAGDWVTVLGETVTKWYYVQCGDLYGYVYADYLLVGDPAYAPFVANPGAAGPGASFPAGGANVHPSSPMPAYQGYTLLTYTDAPNPKSAVRIQYPRFNGAGMEALNEAVYQKVLRMAREPLDIFGQEAGLTCDYQCAVTLFSGKMVSMIFWGSSQMEGGNHPNEDLIPFNVDLTAMREVALADLYSMDANLGNVFFQKAFFPSAPVTSFSADRFPEMLRMEAESFRDSFLYPDSVACFLKPDGIVLSLDAIHATGNDHFEGQLRYGDIQGFCRLGENYWQ